MQIFTADALTIPSGADDDSTFNAILWRALFSTPMSLTETVGDTGLLPEVLAERYCFHINRSPADDSIGHFVMPELWWLDLKTSKYYTKWKWLLLDVLLEGRGTSDLFEIIAQKCIEARLKLKPSSVGEWMPFTAGSSIGSIPLTGLLSIAEVKAEKKYMKPKESRVGEKAAKEKPGTKTSGAKKNKIPKDYFSQYFNSSSSNN